MKYAVDEGILTRLAGLLASQAMMMDEISHMEEDTVPEEMLQALDDHIRRFVELYFEPRLVDHDLVAVVVAVEFDSRRN